MLFPLHSSQGSDKLLSQGYAILISVIICGWVTQCEFKTTSAREEKVAVEQQNRTCLLSPIVTCEPNSQSPCICQLPYSSHHALNCRTSVHDHGVEETLLFDFLFDLLSPAELESSPLSHATRNRRIVLHRLPWRWFGINTHTTEMRCLQTLQQSHWKLHHQLCLHDIAITAV